MSCEACERPFGRKCDVCGDEITIAPTRQTIMMNEGDLELIRQWFDCIHDVNQPYLEKKDFELAKRIYLGLRMRVPESIKAKLV